jgi:hypothetical protein
MSDLAIHAGAVAIGAQSHLMRIGNGARVPMLIYVKPGVVGQGVLDAEPLPARFGAY